MQTPWVTNANAALLTDLYQLTMMQAYFEQDLREQAVFDLFARRLPASRNYLVACGIDDVLRYLETLRFDDDALAYLESLNLFSQTFLDSLASFRFTGDVYAVPEGTPVFANEPIVQVVAPLPEAQLIETFALNQIHFQTMVASKAARVITAASGRAIVEFGLRRLHGTDAGMKAARACYIVGAAGTSNVLAGRVYGIPVYGTMAHSYIEAHDREIDAFEAFNRIFPATTLLVDTYDTIEGVRKVIALAGELGEAFHVRSLRLDSGDLAQLAQEARTMLDEAGLHNVELFASGNLDEYAVADLVARGAPITGFGVGTRMGVSADHPYLDSAYKLAAYAGKPRMKLAPGKSTLPGRKQVFRIQDSDGHAVHDVIAMHDESIDGRPLLVKVMEAGQRLPAGRASLDEIRLRAQQERALLPERLLSLHSADPAYEVRVSPSLAEMAACLRQQLTHAAAR